MSTKIVKVSERDSCGIEAFDFTIFAKRIDAWEDTVKQANRRFRETVPSIKEEDRMLQPRFTKQQVLVKEADTIDMGLIVKDLGYHPVLLNFSDDVFAG